MLQKLFSYSTRETYSALLGENYCPLNQVWLQLGVKVQDAEFVLEMLLHISMFEAGGGWSTDLSCEWCIVEKAHLGSFWKI